jgi:hypothetical protein
MVNETSFEGLVASRAWSPLRLTTGYTAGRLIAARPCDCPIGPHEPPVVAGSSSLWSGAAVALICRQLCPLFVDSRTYREPVDTACGSAGSVRSGKARWTRHLSAPAGDV